MRRFQFVVATILSNLKAESRRFQTVLVSISKDASIESYGRMKFRHLQLSFVTRIKAKVVFPSWCRGSPRPHVRGSRGNRSWCGLRNSICETEVLAREADFGGAPAEEPEEAASGSYISVSNLVQATVSL